MDEPELNLEQAAQCVAKRLLPRWQEHMRSCIELADALDAEGLDAKREAEADMGWALGVLSAASGYNALLVRREARGLARMLSALGFPTNGDGGGAELLPLLSSAAGEGWEAPLLAAWLACHCREGESLAWELQRSGPEWQGRVPLEGDARASRLQLGEAEARVCAASNGECAYGLLRLPRSWVFTQRSAS